MTPSNAAPDPPVANVTTQRRSHLSSLGAYGFEAQEPIILAALVTGDPLLLIGRSGTGKTFLLNSISEALGLAHRHYNASLLSFDDLVGFPYPDEGRTSVRFLETPATIWGAESVLIDEISRCKPEHQNRLFSLVHERRIQGLRLPQLRYRWAAMNPELTTYARVLTRLGEARRKRAQQLLYYCAINHIFIPGPREFEEEFDRCVKVFGQAGRA